MQYGRHLVHEFIAGGAIGAPIEAQALIRREDLLHHQVGRTARSARWTLRAQCLEPVTQLAAVTARIGQPIDVVAAHTIDQALRVQPENRLVRVFEHGCPLDAQAGQLVDVEEAAVVDHVAGELPERQAIVLPFDQRMQRRPSLVRLRIMHGLRFLAQRPPR